MATIISGLDLCAYYSIQCSNTLFFCATLAQHKHHADNHFPVKLEPSHVLWCQPATQCLSQDKLEGSSRKGDWHKHGSDDGGGGTGNQNELEASWIISVNVSISRTHSKPDWL